MTTREYEAVVGTCSPARNWNKNHHRAVKGTVETMKPPWIRLARPWPTFLIQYSPPLISNGNLIIFSHFILALQHYQVVRCNHLSTLFKSNSTNDGPFASQFTKISISRSQAFIASSSGYKHTHPNIGKRKPKKHIQRDESKLSIDSTPWSNIDS